MKEFKKAQESKYSKIATERTDIKQRMTYLEKLLIDNQGKALLFYRNPVLCTKTRNSKQRMILCTVLTWLLGIS